MQRSTSSKALNIGNWVSIVNPNCMLVDYMLPETMKMDFFGEGTKEISSMRVFMRQLLGLVVGYFIGYGILHGLGQNQWQLQKSSTGAGTNVIAGLATE
jgi:K(+)-stimulated pyrophosphate-energized sodium pump